jgi:hypothetical protein
VTPAQVMTGLANMLVDLGAMGSSYDAQAHLIRHALLLIEAAHAQPVPVPTVRASVFVGDVDGVPMAGRVCPSCTGD